MNDIILKNDVKIESLIYEIRGRQVMLDSDLARLYGCANGTKTINLAVKRHINRFPKRFMFQLTIEESENIRFQLETKYGKMETRGGKYNKPYVFTEEGVAMLATVLRTPVAEEVSIRIMDAFVSMRKYISKNLVEHQNLYDLVLEDHHRINKLEDTFQKFEEKRKVHEIYFDGQIYDAYSKILDIFNGAKNELIIIDSYADKKILDIVKDLNIKVVIITRKNNLLKDSTIEEYHKEYHNLTLKYNDTFHDRYFILDNEIVYHCGASVNRIGYKTFSINLIDDSDMRDLLIDKINNI